MEVVGSGGSTVASTLTSGIQNISALLPLLGTEQCEEHLASSLTTGYLYAAATPMSIFGSLGVARAGFKTLLSSISIPRLKFAGAKMLADAGFKPQGTNLSLVMLDEDRKSYCAEERLELMMEELHLDDSNKISLSSKTRRWNILMVLVTAVCSIISITPYIHLNLHEPNSLTPFVRWTFPIVRAIGGFLTATMTQLVIQSRVLEITRKRLILNGLSEKELKVFGIDITDKNLRSTALDEHFLVLEQQVKSQVLEMSAPNPTISSDAASSTHNTLANRVQTDHTNLKIPAPSILINPVMPDALYHAPIANSHTISSHEDPDLEKAMQSKAEKGRESKAEPKEEIPKERLEMIYDRIIEANGSTILRCIFCMLLFIGIVASVAGYIGCFSAVQGVRSSQEALFWLCLEAGLSIIRIILWGLNPKGDDAPPLEIKLKLDKHSPLPTCTSCAEDIEDETVLPLVRATAFLETITSYTGLVKQFSNPTLTLYYTLTRRYNKSEEDHELILREHVLYITVFHHTERTTRVYTENSRTNRMVHDKTYFYSADPVTVNLEHGILMTKIGRPVQHGADPIAGDDILRKALQDHYHSILDQIDLRSRTSPRPEDDTLKNIWTLKLGDAKSEMQNLGDQKVVVNTDRMEVEQLEGPDRMRDCQYLEQGRLDRNVRYLFDTRGQWITDYMEWSHNETGDNSREANEVHGIVMEHDERVIVERMLIVEQWEMEMMLVDEIYGWEEKLRKSFEDFLNSPVSNGLDAALRERLERRCRTGSWERLEKGRLAMEARVHAAEKKLLQRVIDPKEGLSALKDVQSRCNLTIRDAWKQLLASAPTASSSHPSPRIRLNERLENETRDSLTWTFLKRSLTYHKMNKDGRTRCDQGIQKMKSRLRREVEDVEERLERGFQRCREFWSSQVLVALTYSDSKWATFFAWRGEFNAMLHALTSRQNIIHIKIDAGYLDDEKITRIFATRMMMSCTSILWIGRKIPDSVQLPPNILSIRTITHAAELSEAQKDTLRQNQIRSQRTTIEVDGRVAQERVLSVVHSFTLRFFGPPSDYLTLRLIHRSSTPENYFTVDKGRYPIPHSDTLVVEEFRIWNSTLQKSSKLTFTPGSRNTLQFHSKDFTNYTLRDIELLDQNRLPYQPSNGGNEGEDPRPLPPGELSSHIKGVASESGQGENN